MMDLLLDCGVFYCIEGRPGNYYQLSGTYRSPWVEQVADSSRYSHIRNKT